MKQKRKKYIYKKDIIVNIKHAQNLTDHSIQISKK